MAASLPKTGLRPPPPRAVRLGGPQEAAALVDAWPYLDVRTPEEFKAGHVDGAINVPFMFSTPAGMAPNPTFLEDVKSKLQPGGPVIVGCKSGRRSAAASAVLADHYGDILDVDGGYDAWVSAGLPVVM
ncbi:hypothetical protein Rsub_00680 [Raphidocelis subcapitata]|uniref:Rhodanese domain-containing protein n=1 Tax=Raphidocelis subcapitata TaxID=307507 RepID=A0A2V0NKU8_9CHLO|nr:hypothetical protein Rsub_00680 [Raphidocelis subcapitata]|eukprot:GBF87968.1 hypothetical protein Rsub_00680 [Raphidocelis subcapitata]